MFRVTKQIDFCYGHRLLNYDGKCRHLHGHNGRVEVHIEAGKLDARGMVQDFSEIKEAVKNWIDDTLDHRMLLHKDEARLWDSRLWFWLRPCACSRECLLAFRSRLPAPT